MNNMKVLVNGIVKENPTFVLLLGMCPTLGTTSSAINGMGMGLATMFVLVCSNAVISAIKNLIPDMVRIPSFIVIIAAFVTVVDMLMAAYLPGLHAALGIFILRSEILIFLETSSNVRNITVKVLYSGAISSSESSLYNLS